MVTEQSVVDNGSDASVVGEVDVVQKAGATSAAEEPRTYLNVVMQEPGWLFTIIEFIAHAASEHECPLKFRSYFKGLISGVTYKLSHGRQQTPLDIALKEAARCFDNVLPDSWLRFSSICKL